ncbi:hypothetical protein RB623_10030 [Mesorhizobium sp. LHD-90]|uniref:hypothetical protein n=1 Tax=Mesorhizobium sp. LHD-90 TaxID=3071414 RepID=UPI0027E136AE|nr:hypothetical protein [Mesorhizobium sp. LHD-90]MDQ6434386.1 hypothetical protein [Mesorhizobium sp. LHD-90]
MLRDEETGQLLDAATDFALAVCTADDPCRVLELETAEVFARQHGLLTGNDAYAVLALCMVMVERRGPLIRQFRTDYAAAIAPPVSGTVQ